MYNYLIQDENPFPIEHEVEPIKIVPVNVHPGAAQVNVAGVWHMDFLNSHGDLLICCQNIENGASYISITRGK